MVFVSTVVTALPRPVGISVAALNARLLILDR